MGFSKAACRCRGKPLRRSSAVSLTSRQGYSTFPSPQPSLASTSKQTLYEPPLADVQSHLSRLLHPLPALPDRLALRLCTHKSALTHKVGNHNARAAFYGRRILRLHLGLFLASQSTPAADLLANGGAL